MDLRIDPATPADCESVVVLWQACGLTVSYNDPRADFEFALNGANSTILVARDDKDAIRGATMVGHDGHRGWLYYVGTDPGLRGTGIGGKLVEAAEEWLRQRGVPKIQLMVRESNTQVVSFYERLGYEETPRIIMAKWLNKPVA